MALQAGLCGETEVMAHRSLVHLSTADADPGFCRPLAWVEQGLPCCMRFRRSWQGPSFGQVTMSQQARQC